MDQSTSRIELLWFGGCPNHAEARALLTAIVAAHAPGTPILDVEATDPATAASHRFPGSPTIRIDGRDVEPRFRDPGDYTPRCRVYWTDDGPRGVPPRAWIEAGLAAAKLRRNRVDRHRTPGRPDAEDGPAA